jgi:lysophospholipase L1-like esterase
VTAGLLGAAPVFAATKVACVGDSITAGAGTTGGNAYPAVLGRMLGAAYEVGNFGDSGSTAMKLPQSTSYWITPAFGNSKTFAPQVVVVMLGTNDSKTNIWKAGNNAFEADYRALLAVYAGLPGKPRIYVNLPPPALTANFSIDGKVIASEIIPLLRRIDTGATVIDVNGAFNPDPRKYFGAGDGTDIGDGIHPNNAGAMAIARAVAQKLTQLAPDAGADARGSEDAGRADAASDAAVAADDATAGDTGTSPGGNDAGAPIPDARLIEDSRRGGAGGAPDDPGGTGGSVVPRTGARKGGCALAAGSSGAGSLLALLLLGLARRRRR